MASPMEAIKKGLAKTKTMNKAAKNNYIGDFGYPDDKQMARSIFRGEQNAEGETRPRGEQYRGDSKTSKLGASKLAGPKVGARLGAVGAASGILDTASEIDNIRKGKSDILQRTGIYKQPKEL